MKPAWILTLVLFSSLVAPRMARTQATSTVFVTFDADEDTPAAKRREVADSARDVREQIQKRDNLEAADNRGAADVLVTILDRRIEVNPSGENDWGGALKQTHYQSRHILFFRMETHAAVEESEIALAGAFVTWKRVAGVLAKDVEKWARGNR